MRRIAALVAVAVGLTLALVLPAASPAAAYNNAPASHICGYVANSEPWHPAHVAYCRDINWFGHYGVDMIILFDSNEAGCEDGGFRAVYDRHNGKLTVVDTWC